MLHDASDEPERLSAAELQLEYEAELAAVVDAIGVDAVVEESGVDRDTVEALDRGESPEITVSEAAAILAVAADHPEADAIVYELRDHLLMGMTTGVLDVDTIAANIDVDLTGQEVQQALEGRTEMTLEQLAAIHGLIAERNDR
ncbi:DUF5791 family protein [Haloferacaceae archaeon DSL9]